MRNADPYVEEAVHSVLKERSLPIELIIVDDGSTDRSREKILGISDERVRLIDGPCRGIAAAYNAALDAARGAILMRCDADDLYPEGRIKRQVRWLDSNEEFGAVCGGFMAVDPDGTIEIPLSTSGAGEEITEELLAGVTRTSLCTFAIRIEILRRTGGMREFFRTGEDVDLQLRVGETCRVWHSPDVTYAYRIHANSITHTRTRQENAFFEIMARKLQIQRRSLGSDDLALGRQLEVPSFDAGIEQSPTEHLQKLLIGTGWAALSAGEFRRAMKCAFKAAVVKSSSISGWRNLAAISCKMLVTAMARVIK